MQVQPVTFLSDHRPLLLKISHSSPITNDKHEAIPLQDIPEKINIKDLNLFKTEIEAVHKDKQNELLADIHSSDHSEDSIYNIVNKIENIFIKTGEKCKTKYRRAPKSNENKNRRNKHKPWYNKDCKVIKRQLNKLCKSLSKNPNNSYTRGVFFSMRKKYKSKLKEERRNYEQALTMKLESLYRNNNDEFWKCLKQMREHKHENQEDLPLTDTLIAHYEKLY